MPTDFTTKEIKFLEMWEELKKRQCLTEEELDWFHNIKKEGIINTAILRKHQNVYEEVQTINDFHPISFHQYRSMYEIGEGSYSNVYKAWEINTNNIVAIKRLKPEKVTDVHKERFLREIQLLKELQHPNILSIVDSGEEEGDYFLVIPYVKNTMEDEMENLPSHRNLLIIAPFLAMILEICNALQYAHDHKIIHRDVKPANILLKDMHPYLADFGLARHLEQNAKITIGAVGTPCYMAPELWQKQALPQSDIYSLGVILYELITGKYPFQGKTEEDILMSQLSVAMPKPPITDNMPFPKELNPLIRRALHQDPNKRHNSVYDFSQELIQILKNHF
ncbi:MAG TPA: serine/threonine-protein kinase [Planctomycetota bacterium]|nr:serine/threonine-protein kinase [Planctomycetota bacterium]HRU52077.1 serine/threonine-protein kinase [Planctomycetota bacterium]